MDTTVRKQKSGDQLVAGDWLAPGEISDFAAEVLYVISYPGEGGSHHRVVLRNVGQTVPFTDVLFGGHLFDLASEDLAAYREAGRRAQVIADIHAFADWLDANAWAPLPNHLDAAVHLDERHFGGPSVADAYSRVRGIAGLLGVEPEERLDDRTVVRKDFGQLDYSVIAWHPDGRPAEPAPEPHPSWTEAELRPWADRVAESMKPIDPDSSMEAHYDAEADPTGLAYSRADEADDPTPVSGARVGMHTGAVTETGLVDETERGERVEVGAEGCGCPITEEIRPNSSSIEGTERVEHRPNCWNAAEGATEEAEAPAMAASGLTVAADQSRGVLAGTTPVVTYFSFGHDAGCGITGAHGPH